MRTLSALVFLAACTGGPGEQTILELDTTGYIAEVDGYVAVGCATLDCHGNAGRPLRLYSETGLRDSRDRDLPLTMAELEDNVLSFAGLDQSPPLQNLAVLKPLAGSAGGLDHVGGDVWSDVNDPGYVCVLAWLEGRVNEERAACAEARAGVMLPPAP